MATARVAKHRLFVWLKDKTLPDSQVIAFARDDDYFFGVLHSRAHELWALKKRTLTNLYNARPTWLANAHAVLDEAVFKAYGWSKGVSDEDILANLLALNLERSGDAGG